MRIIYIQTLNVCFTFFNKSGSSLLIAWMENLLRYLEIDYMLFTTPNHNEWREHLTFISNKNPKFYLFVRNPLERMVTSFYWTETFDIKSQPTQYPVDSIIDYSNKITDVISNTNDMHILPQTWEMVRFNNNLNNVEHNLNTFSSFRYDKRMFKDSEISIVKIETFFKNFEALMSYSNSMLHYPSYQNFERISENNYFEKSIGQLKEILENRNNFCKFNSVLLLNFFIVQFNKSNHHKNLYKGMINQLQKTKDGVESLIKLNYIISNESKWLGYDNSLFTNLNQFTTI